MKRIIGLAVLTCAVLFSSQPIAEAGKPPAAPVKPVITSVIPGSGGVELAWEDGNNPSTGFDVERRRSAAGFAVIDSIGKTQLSYTDSTVVAGNTYYYRVRSYYEKSGAEQWSVYSDEAGPVTIPFEGCVSDADCDDGLFCNGAESCDGSGSCVAGSPPDCGDGVSCTVDSCDEAADTCVSTPNDSLCNDGLFCTGAEVCDLSAGCISAGDPCGAGETCNESSNSCDVPQGAVCGNGVVESGEACDDGNAAAGDGCENDCTVTTGPLTPGGLTAAGVASTRIDVTWSDNSDNEQGFDLWRYHTSTGWQSIVKTGANVSSYSDGGLAPDAAYRYAVRAYNVAGNSGWSNILDVTTSSGGAGCSVDADCDDGLFCNGAETCDGAGSCVSGAAPVCDDGVACTSDSCNEAADACVNAPDDGLCDDGLFCTGTESCDAAAGCVSTGDPCSGEEICSESTNSCDLPQGAQCGNGTVETGEACDDGNTIAGDGCDGDCTVTTPPTSPALLTASDVSATQAAVGWSDRSDNEQGFDIWRYHSSTGWMSIVKTGANVDSYSDAGVDPATAYKYAVRAFNVAGNSGWSNIIDVTTPSGAGGCATDADCDDGLYCNGAETCDGTGSCVAGTAPDCDSGVSCTVDSCDEAADTCVSVPNDGLCDDGLFCTGTETCDAATGCVSTGDPCSGGETCSESTNSCDAAAVCGNGTVEAGEECDDGNTVPGDGCENDCTVTPVSGGGELRWSRHFGGPDSFDIAYGHHVAVDPVTSEIVVTGKFSQNADFGGGAFAAAGKEDVFLVKYSPEGGYRWSRAFGGPEDEEGSSVAISGNGTVVMAGWFSGSLDLGGATLTSAGGDDIFIAAYDADGNHRWSRAFGSATNDHAYAVAVDNAGNIVVTGYFTGSVDFGNGILTANGSDVFVAKFRDDGTPVWSKQAGGTATDASTAIAVDGSGNVVITGYFYGNIDFGGELFTSAGSYDVFAAKYYANGNLAWAGSYGNGSSDQGAAVAVDPLDGSVILSGSFYGEIDLGGGPLVDSGYGDIFVAKLSAGGVHQWSKGFGSSWQKADEVGAVAVDHVTGEIVLTGSVLGNMDFGGETLMSDGDYDAFLAKFTSGGVHRWSKRAGGVGYDSRGRGVAIDQDGNVVATGFFDDETDFGGELLVNEGGYDVFLHKFWP